MGIQVPERTAAPAMSAVAYCVCIEELARVDPSIALSVAAHNGLCVAHLKAFGSEAQKRRYPAAAGRRPAPRRLGIDGSQLGQRRGRDAHRGDARRPRLGAERQQAVHHARPHRRHDRRDGGHGPRAGQGRHFRVRDSAGPSRHAAPARRKTSSGMRASDTSEVIFQDCRVPARRMIGAPGEGFMQAMQMLDAGRIGIAALAVGPGAGRLREPRAATRSSAGSSAGRSPSSRRFAGSWPTWPRGSKRRGC